MTKIDFILKEFVKQAVNSSVKSKQELEDLKRKFAKKKGVKCFQTSQILKVYKELLKKKEILPASDFKDLLILKKVRTISGVAPLAIFTRPYPCPGKCIYCPIQKGIPKSYLDDEPAVMRAINADFNPKLQIKHRLQAYENIGHSPEKIELIVMGGSWSVLPYSYQEKFIKDCFDACNQRESRSLKEAQELNAEAKYRIVGLSLETRPDLINEKEIKTMRKFGVTKIEIGVQSVFDDVLKKIQRGHSVKEVTMATQLLKDAGVKVCYHLMPNLPGSSLERDLEMFKIVFADARFCPDMVKIYPCVVTFQAPLYKQYKEGKFKPYSDKDLVELLINIKQTLPEWVRVNRLGRDIPIDNIAAGNKLSNIRQIVWREMGERNLKCRCIRCREVRFKEKFKIENLRLKIVRYSASGGKEYFLQFIDSGNNLYALLRLRISSQIKPIFKVLEKAAIVRELHTFGPALAIGVEPQKESQHRGLGKKLLQRAEKISKDLGFRKIAVIAGVGARSYYQRWGYKLKEGYMVKAFD